MSSEMTFEESLEALKVEYGLSESEHARELARAVADLQD